MSNKHPNLFISEQELKIAKKNVRIIEEKLKNDGFLEEDTARIHNPIGLGIGSETPGEIAISIAAELIAVRAGIGVN